MFFKRTTFIALVLLFSQNAYAGQPGDLYASMFAEGLISFMGDTAQITIQNTISAEAQIYLSNFLDCAISNCTSSGDTPCLESCIPAH